MKKVLSVLTILGILIFTTIGIAGAIPITIDMSDHGVGVFNKNFFVTDGVVFTDGDYVQSTQGDDSLLFGSNIVAGHLTTKSYTEITATVAPRLQGTWEYRLTALRDDLTIIDTVSLKVIQDTGDPNNQGFGYVSIGLTNLHGAKAFDISASFISSSFGTQVEYNSHGLASLDIKPVPEPATMLLFGTGFAGLAGAYRRRKKK